jgi:pimeloyl-ACP methyl ester carboxylesterase
MPRVLIVPGAAVRAYVRSAADAVRHRGADVELLPAPGQPGQPPDLREYGEQLARRLEHGGRVDMLVGLSVGGQAAAVATGLAPGMVGHLVLVGPTVDPRARTAPALLARWLSAGRNEPPRVLREQAPEWARAGIRSLARIVRSAVSLRIEDEALDPAAKLTVVHAERDVVTSHAYAAELAAARGGRLVVVPAATHSWPFQDADRFSETVAELLR